ncbi:hypothetical protein TNCV_1465431 [Trichonephila clavipes]|nr:hypothetical protein TNCV_1465431 [Trichonephila clavipes]
MKVTWCEIRTVIYFLQTKNCITVLRCRRRLWNRVVIQQQDANFEMSRSLFRIASLQFRQGVTVPRIIDGSILQKFQENVNASSVCLKPRIFLEGFFEAY